MEIRSISTAAAFRVALTIFGVIIALRFVWVAYTVFIITFLGILIGLGLSRAVDALERLGMRRGLAAPLTMLLALAILAGLGALGAASLKKQTQQLRKELPRVLQSAERGIESSPARILIGGDGGGASDTAGGTSKNAPPADMPESSGPEGKPPNAAGPQAAGTPADGPKHATEGQPTPVQHAGDRRQDGATQPRSSGRQQTGDQGAPGGLRGQLTREAQGLNKLLFPIVSSVFGALAGLVMVIFIAMYIAAEPRLYREGMLHLVPKRNRARAREVILALGDTLRRWLVARFIAMVVVGTVTGLALKALGVRGALVLGVLSGLLEFVPFFGPIASAVPAIAAAMLDSPQKALSVAVLYVVIQQLEGSALTPLLLEKRLDIPPVLTLVFVAALGVVFGILGMLIAEPILAVVLVTVRMLYVEDVVGDEVANSRG